MQNRIRQTLHSISKDHDVRILYACESGSRAWGFASHDSDWDVRFLYLRKPGWYLSIDLEHKPDVIELLIVDDPDMGNSINRLMTQKMAGQELDWAPGTPYSEVFWKPSWTAWKARALKSGCNGVRLRH